MKDFRGTISRIGNSSPGRKDFRRLVENTASRPGVTYGDAADALLFLDRIDPKALEAAALILMREDRNGPAMHFATKVPFLPLCGQAGTPTTTWIHIEVTCLKCREALGFLV
jgi:hypothetical protein